MEIPFGPGGGEHIAGIDTQSFEDSGKFIHQCDVEIALGVFDHFCGFGHFDRGRAVDAGLDDGTIDFGDDLASVFSSWPATTFVIVSKRCSLSPGLIRSGE